MEGPGSSLASCLDLPAGGAVGQGAEQLCCVLEPGPGPPAAGGLQERGKACSWCMDHSPDQPPSPARPAAEARSDRIDERDFLPRFLAKSVFPHLGPVLGKAGLEGPLTSGASCSLPWQIEPNLGSFRRFCVLMCTLLSIVDFRARERAPFKTS